MYGKKTYCFCQEEIGESYIPTKKNTETCVLCESESPYSAWYQYASSFFLWKNWASSAEWGDYRSCNQRNAYLEKVYSV